MDDLDFWLEYGFVWRFEDAEIERCVKRKDIVGDTYLTLFEQIAWKVPRISHHDIWPVIQTSARDSEDPILISWCGRPSNAENRLTDSYPSSLSHLSKLQSYNSGICSLLISPEMPADGVQ